MSDLSKSYNSPKINKEISPKHIDKIINFPLIGKIKDFYNSQIQKIKPAQENEISMEAFNKEVRQREHIASKSHNTSQTLKTGGIGVIEKEEQVPLTHYPVGEYFKEETTLDENEFIPTVEAKFKKFGEKKIVTKMDRLYLAPSSVYGIYKGLQKELYREFKENDTTVQEIKSFVSNIVQIINREDVRFKKKEEGGRKKKDDQIILEKIATIKHIASPNIFRKFIAKTFQKKQRTQKEHEEKTLLITLTQELQEYMKNCPTYTDSAAKKRAPKISDSEIKKLIDNGELEITQMGSNEDIRTQK